VVAAALLLHGRTVGAGLRRRARDGVLPHHAHGRRRRGQGITVVEVVTTHPAPPLLLLLLLLLLLFMLLSSVVSSPLHDGWEKGGYIQTVWST
jgi:hypothetical protein